ncbi:hypothetical protein WOLCODRAFT_145429 [Wolfiporia cocos MD-104 SS10]|uniref:Uncharacterized protein n=1 Tax=Wolfiporia cocos (strain MD-104) TaxID=742152 RepID=A0A2H3IY47_WOLCO|nr:hypothetical protein WOLCODRAFT_145429 [Wolfiporia cocos MD-104 SS10]
MTAASTGGSIALPMILIVNFIEENLTRDQLTWRTAIYERLRKLHSSNEITNVEVKRTHHPPPNCKFAPELDFKAALSELRKFEEQEREKIRDRGVKRYIFIWRTEDSNSQCSAKKNPIYKEILNIYPGFVSESHETLTAAGALDPDEASAKVKLPELESLLIGLETGEWPQANGSMPEPSGSRNAAHTGPASSGDHFLPPHIVPSQRYMPPRGGSFDSLPAPGGYYAYPVVGHRGSPGQSPVIIPSQRDQPPLIMLPYQYGIPHHTQFVAEHTASHVVPPFDEPSMAMGPFPPWPAGCPQLSMNEGRYRHNVGGTRAAPNVQDSASSGSGAFRRGVPLDASPMQSSSMDALPTPRRGQAYDSAPTQPQYQRPYLQHPDVPQISVHPLRYPAPELHHASHLSEHSYNRQNTQTYPQQQILPHPLAYHHNGLPILLQPLPVHDIQHYPTEPPLRPMLPRHPASQTSTPHCGVQQKFELAMHTALAVQTHHYHDSSHRHQSPETPLALPSIPTEILKSSAFKRRHDESFISSTAVPPTSRPLKRIRVIHSGSPVMNIRKMALPIVQPTVSSSSGLSQQPSIYHPYSSAVDSFSGSSCQQTEAGDEVESTTLRREVDVSEEGVNRGDIKGIHNFSDVFFKADNNRSQTNENATFCLDGFNLVDFNLDDWVSSTDDDNYLGGSTQAVFSTSSTTTHTGYYDSLSGHTVALYEIVTEAPQEIIQGSAQIVSEEETDDEGQVQNDCEAAEGNLPLAIARQQPRDSELPRGNKDPDEDTGASNSGSTDLSHAGVLETHAEAQQKTHEAATTYITRDKVANGLALDEYKDESVIDNNVRSAETLVSVGAVSSSPKNHFPETTNANPNIASSGSQRLDVESRLPRDDAATQDAALTGENPQCQTHLDSIPAPVPDASLGSQLQQSSQPPTAGAGVTEDLTAFSPHGDFITDHSAGEFDPHLFDWEDHDDLFQSAAYAT